MKCQEFNCEKDCTITRLDSQQELFNYVGKTIHVMPYYWNNTLRELSVLVNKKHLFKIPIEELSIYPFKDPFWFPSEIKYLFKIGVLSVKVLLDDQGKLYLSRKANMEDALVYFQNKIGTVISAQLRSIHKNYTLWELGAGILGKVGFYELSNCFTSSFKEVFTTNDLGEYYSLKILDCSSTVLNKFELSLKQAFKAHELSQGDCVLGRISSFTPDGTGVFVEINPLTTGIMDIDNINVYPYKMEDSSYEKPYIIIGKTYPFIVKKVLDCNTGIHCRLLLVFTT